jgi:hypothetical protein
MTKPPPKEDCDQVVIFSAAEVDSGNLAPELSRVLAWARSYLVSHNPELGRSGPVCPYTQPALRRNLFYLAMSMGVDVQAAVDCLRIWYERATSAIPTADQELLTVLLVLPHLDPVDPTPLDDLQRKAKDDFVDNGLMIGQFHPACEAPGLWNPHFRPLRAPIPLLAIRKLVVFDLPFLIDKKSHLDSFLRRFAPDIPSRVRGQLTARLAAH